MLVTIMRHGEAGSAVTDQRRELTARGTSEAKKAAVALLAACSRWSVRPPDELYFSRWVRTTQTARLVAEALGLESRQSIECLIPGSAASATDRLLEGLDAECHVVLVSHQPLVSRLVDRYSGEPGRVPGLSPAGFATVRMEIPGQGCGELLFWALPPIYEINR